MTDKQPTARLIIDPSPSPNTTEISLVKPPTTRQPSVLLAGQVAPETLVELIELKKSARHLHLRWLGVSLVVMLLAASLLSFSFVFGLLDEATTLWLAASLALLLTTGLLAFHWWTRRA